MYFFMSLDCISDSITKWEELGKLSRLLFLRSFTVDSVDALLNMPDWMSLSDDELSIQLNRVKSVCDKKDLESFSSEYQTFLKDIFFSFINLNMDLANAKRDIYNELYWKDFILFFILVKSYDDVWNVIQVNSYAFFRDNLASCINNNLNKIKSDVTNFKSFKVDIWYINKLD